MLKSENCHLFWAYLMDSDAKIVVTLNNDQTSIDDRF